jgi:hypothetical protein
MTTLTLKGSSKRKLNIIEALAKELGLSVQKSEYPVKEKAPNVTTAKAIKEAKAGKTTRVSIDGFRKLLYA